MTKGLLLEDKELFDDLVASIKPKMIICLGKLTYEVVSGVKADGVCKEIKNRFSFQNTLSVKQNYSRVWGGTLRCTRAEKCRRNRANEESLGGYGGRVPGGVGNNSPPKCHGRI